VKKTKCLIRMKQFLEQYNSWLGSLGNVPSHDTGRIDFYILYRYNSIFSFTQCIYCWKSTELMFVYQPWRVPGWYKYQMIIFYMHVSSIYYTRCESDIYIGISIQCHDQIIKKNYNQRVSRYFVKWKNIYIITYKYMHICIYNV